MGRAGIGQSRADKATGRALPYGRASPPTRSKEGVARAKGRVGGRETNTDFDQSTLK
jgi:hypothetical protein